ncbi:EAL domain-containing protein [Streptosporangium sp. NPDC048047]|uniref:EAL domain-containing protein n=1 Tax=Streptosporangium sp. NPDC048047 TaxID=3155748 RepID=UPI00342CC8BA
MPSGTPPFSPASGPAAAAPAPVVDLATGGVIALQPAVRGENLSSVLRAIPHVTGAGTRMPLLLPLPSTVVIGGSAALAPLHEALRVSGRRPPEVILLVQGDFAPIERRTLLTGLEGIRAVGYLTAIGELGTGHVPLDLLADAAPYLAVLSPALMAEVPRDRRRATLAESLSGLARRLGVHMLAPAVTRESQLAAVRSWGVRLAQGPLLVPGPSGRVHVPLPVAERELAAAPLGPRVQEFLLPAVTLPCEATAEEVTAAFGGEPSITSVVLVDEYQRPRSSLDRGRFLLAVAGRFGHALHARRPAARLADPARTVPRSTPAVTAMRAAGHDPARVYDDLVVIDEMGRCIGIVRVSDLIRHVTAETR